MPSVGDIVDLAGRQASLTTEPPVCEIGNEYDGRLNLRIAAIFVIWVASTIGVCFPVYAERHKALRVPGWSFFIAKYFGSGVIVATAFIHLLAPAQEALGNECLTGPITEYAWVEGMMLMTIFVLFFVELMVMRYTRFDNPTHTPTHDPSDAHSGVRHPEGTLQAGHKPDAENPAAWAVADPMHGVKPCNSHVPGEDHLGHRREHQDHTEEAGGSNTEEYAAQLTSIFILEFGIIFHSIFIGLTLAVAGEEFVTLFVVLVFHQTFEGLGLGSRLAVVSWPSGKRWTPYILGLAYGFSTPIAIAAGLGVRETYPPGSATTLIVNGVFDSISAGILIYTGLVELMAHEFMFSSVMQKAKLKVVLGAFGTMCLGAGLMALLGKWA